MKKLSKVLIFDTDVVVNVLAQEIETLTDKPLWVAPLKLFEKIEQNHLRGLLSVTSLLEIRYLMRRKKEYSEEKIESYIKKLLGLLEIVIPDEIALLKANELQTNELLDPFDSILLSVGISINPSFLVSRDKSFLKIASKYISNCCFPEELVSIL
jgi:predicted nucleic acid-binding protein